MVGTDSQCPTRTIDGRVSMQVSSNKVENDFLIRVEIARTAIKGASKNPMSSRTKKTSKEPALAKDSARRLDDDEFSDAGSHMEDSDYERDGFVVDDEEYTSSGDDGDGDEEDAFIKENQDKLVVDGGHEVGGRVLRTRRKPKSLQEIYDELCRDVEDHEAELAEIVDELASYKGRRGLSTKERKDKAELQKDKTFVEERLKLLRQKVEDMEEDHKTFHGDIEGLEEKRASLEKRLDVLENEMAEAERSGDDKAYSKAGKAHKKLSNELDAVENQIADYHEEQAVAKGEDDDESDISMSDSEDSYDSEASVESDDDDDDDYDDDDSVYSD